MAISEEYWTEKQVAGHFGCGVSTVWRWTRNNKFPSPVRIGGITRWRRSDIEKSIAGDGGTDDRAENEDMNYTATLLSGHDKSWPTMPSKSAHTRHSSRQFASQCSITEPKLHVAKQNVPKANDRNVGRTSRSAFH